MQISTILHNKTTIIFLVRRMTMVTYPEMLFNVAMWLQSLERQFNEVFYC